MSNEPTKANLVDGLVATLDAIPDAAARIEHREERQPGNRMVDAIVALEIAGNSLLLVVETKHSGFPRDVREAIWKLRDYVAHFPSQGRQIVPVVAAESISPGARTLLREERVGYFDAGGSLYLSAHGSYLFIDKPPSKQGRRSARSLFEGRRAQVLHALWSKGAEWFGVHDVARLASVSPTTVSETMAALEQREWVISRGAGPSKERRLSDRRALMNAWTEYQKSARPPSVRRFYVPASSTDSLLRRVDQVCDGLGVIYAITGEAAAQAYAPYLSSVSQLRCRLLAGAPAENAIHMLEAHTVREGWNLAVIDAKSSGDFVFRERKDNAWFASPLQTYLDLLQSGGRSRELADHLREEKLEV